MTCQPHRWDYIWQTGQGLCKAPMRPLRIRYRSGEVLAPFGQVLANCGVCHVA